MSLTVSMLAAEAGVKPDTIRYYEKAGLLPVPARTRAGYRLYGAEAVERLRLICGVQSFGLRLREIRELLQIMDRRLCPCGHTKGLVRGRIAELDEEIRQRREVRTRLTRLAEEVRSVDQQDPEGLWPCQREFIEIASNDKGR